jgi:hypothetical protein
MQTLIRLDNQGLEWLTHIVTESAYEARIELQLDDSWSVEDFINFIELVSINAKTKLLERVRGLPSKDVYKTLGSFVDQICHTLLEDTLDYLQDTHIITHSGLPTVQIQRSKPSA